MKIRLAELSGEWYKKNYIQQMKVRPDIEIYEKMDGCI